MGKEDGPSCHLGGRKRSRPRSGPGALRVQTSAGHQTGPGSSHSYLRRSALIFGGARLPAQPGLHRQSRPWRSGTNSPALVFDRAPRGRAKWALRRGLLGARAALSPQGRGPGWPGSSGPGFSRGGARDAAPGRLLHGWGAFLPEVDAAGHGGGNAREGRGGAALER